MIISFFEEFPTPENLQKLKFITWPSKLYIAAKSLEEFYIIVSSIKNKNITEIIYWPIVEKREGYWISPFTQKDALHRTFNELNDKNIPVMLDLELPVTQRPSLLITELFHFFSNKRMIQHFIATYKGQIYLAEYTPQRYYQQKILSTLGLNDSVQRTNDLN